MYRIDRFSEEIQRNKKIIFPQINLFVLIFLSLIYLLDNNLLIIYPLGIFYSILSYRSLSMLLKRKWKLPVFTKKMIIISGLGFTAWLISSFYFRQNIVVFILLFELLLPLFIFFSVEIIELPAGLIRRYSMLRARKRREEFKDLLVIGITGSYGKSSTKEFLYTLLSGKYGSDKVLKTVDNVNTEIGIANTVLGQLKKEHKFFICEMGAYRKGEIKTSCNIVKPKIGVLTGINEQHLAIFGSQENIIKAKFELIDSLPQGGVAILNKDSENVRKEDISLHNKGLKKVVWCSTKEDSEVSAKNIEAKKDGISFTMDSKKVSVPVIGAHNVQNILLAVAVAKELGISFEEIIKGLSNIPKGLNAMKVKLGEINVIDSSYSANSNGVISDLEYLKLFEGPKLVIMPSLIELGRASHKVHERIGKKISEVCDLGIITTQDGYDEVKKGGGDTIVYLDNPRDIMKTVKDMGIKTILLEGRSSPSITSLFI